MKEIKAYIKMNKLSEVIKALHKIEGNYLTNNNLKHATALMTYEEDQYGKIRTKKIL